MFLCCLPICRGRSLSRARKERPGRKGGLLSRSRRLWTFVRRDTEVTQGRPGWANPGQATTVVPLGQPYVPSLGVCVCVLVCVCMCVCVWKGGLCEWTTARRSRLMRG